MCVEFASTNILDGMMMKRVVVQCSIQMKKGVGDKNHRMYANRDVEVFAKSS